MRRKIGLAVCAMVAGLTMFGCGKSESTENNQTGAITEKTVNSDQNEKVNLTLDEVMNAPATDEQYFTYKETEGGIRILKCEATDEIVVMPDEIGGQRIVELDASAFVSIGDSVKGIYISNGIENIEDNTFSNMKQLEVVVLGSEVKVIGTAFGLCPVREVSIQSSQLSKVVSYAFNNCKELQAVYFNGTVETVEMAAFSGCSVLEEVHFKGDVEVLEEKAFFASKPTLYGPADSNIEQYAKENDFSFIAQ